MKNKGIRGNLLASALIGLLSCQSAGFNDTQKNKSEGELPVESGVEKIVFVSYRHGHRELYDINIDGSKERRLTFSDDMRIGLSCTSPKYSPDGKKIVFGRVAGGIYTINADGSNERRLGNIFGETPDWSPDGQRIVYASTSSEICTANSKDGGNIKILTDGRYRDSDPCWGKEDIYFVREYAKDKYDICFIEADGSGFKRITDEPSISSFDPAISPDSKRLAYVEESDGVTNIYAMNVKDHSDKVKVTKGVLEGKISINPSWSHSGEEIILASAVDSTNLELFSAKSDGSSENPLRLTNSQLHDYMPDCAVVKRD